MNMNRFRRRKEARDALEGFSRPSTDSDTPTISIPKKAFRLGKKTTEPLPKTEIDLKTALPSSDDFRTSLLMNGLSARFSMLREQDNPNTKIGKACDDSVMFPKRVSRLNDFGIQSYCLTDIAEVSSIRSSNQKREIERAISNASLPDYGINKNPLPNNSIMHRSRPCEGNNLFGGRLKVNVGNRVLYEHDVRLSAHQEQRRLERDSLSHGEGNEDYPTLSTDILEVDSVHNHIQEPTTCSPCVTSVFNTDSDLPNGIQPSKSSTSGSPERRTTKSRRLYEVCLENDLYEQQFSAKNKIDILTRQTSLIFNSPFSPGPSPILNSQRNSTRDQQMNKRSSGTDSQSVLAQKSSLPTTKHRLVSPIYPLSRPSSANEERVVLPSRTNDRAKLQEISNQSMPQCSDTNLLPRKQFQSQTASGLEKTLSQNQISSQGSKLRSRTGSEISSDSLHSKSSSTSEMPQMHDDNVPSLYEPKNSNQSSSDLSSLPGTDSTVNFHSKLPCDEAYNLKNHSETRENYSSSADHPLSSIHPLKRDYSFDIYSENNNSPLTPESPQNTAFAVKPTSTQSQIIGMVRQHIRCQSDASSIYAITPMSEQPESPLYPVYTNPCTEYLNQVGPWDGDYDENNIVSANVLGMVDQDPSESDDISLPVMSNHDDYFANHNGVSKNLSEIKEFETCHNRHESTDTLIEQWNLKHELANRKRLVQEKMKSFRESDNHSSSVSQMPEFNRDFSVRNGAFGILKPKNSRGSIKPKDGQSKTMKMLGLGNVSSTNITSSYKNNSGEDDDDGEDTLTGIRRSNTPQGSRIHRKSHHDLERERIRQLAIRHGKSEVEHSVRI